MNRFPNPDKPVLEALFDAQRIAFAPFVFQATRVALKLGLLEALGSSDEGLSTATIAERTQISAYGAQVLLETLLTAGIVRQRTGEPGEEACFQLTKTGHCLAFDPMTRANLEFTHEVCYRGLAHLEDAIRDNRPAGLVEFGPWETIYPALSSLPNSARESWFRFDHFHSDAAFTAALRVVASMQPSYVYDIGGNTGRWARECLAALPEARVAIVDLPEQLALAAANPELDPYRDRLGSIAMNWLDETRQLPAEPRPDLIWMSQFLDCFAPEQVASILRRARAGLAPGGHILIMEPLWDEQRHPAASFSLTCTSLYFTAMANGNSRMFGGDELRKLIAEAGLKIEDEHHELGISHALFICSSDGQAMCESAARPT